MFVCSHSLRHLLNDVILQRLNKQLFVQSKYLIRYQSKLNVENEIDEKQMGLFDQFDIQQPTQKRLKGFFSIR